MAFKPFEKSSKDKEMGGKFGKEGSKKEEAFDRKQMGAKPAAKKAPSKKKC